MVGSNVVETEGERERERERQREEERHNWVILINIYFLKRLIFLNFKMQIFPSSYPFNAETSLNTTTFRILLTFRLLQNYFFS